MINSFPISWTIEPAILHVLLISKRYTSISIRFLADSSHKTTLYFAFNRFFDPLRSPFLQTLGSIHDVR